MKITELISGIFQPAATLIDELHTSDEERLQAKGHLLDVQAAAMQRVFDYEKEMIKGQYAVISAEAKSEHFIVAAWRPITMLTFLALAVGDSLGFLTTPLRDEAWTLLHLGLGGYVVGRSGEKIVKSIKQS